MTPVVVPLWMALALLPCLLSGCGSPPQIDREPHSEAEIKAFAQDMLGRSSLSPDKYQKYKKALATP
ncbi:hypothetical protein HA520_18555 [Azotobacter chroococcum]|uniref:Lipoprotein n=1 Tax=Azotobacter chroococcum TaxID=353 RepID=A0AA43Z964_9GAMM|nr:hypothetical protein [Azotobacter chroococcum]NHN79258.1 hypothetical protein [Azotobacter chroococcum]